MRSGSYLQSAYAERVSPRRRAAALLAALAANLFLVLLLLRLAPGFRPPPGGHDVITVQLMPEARERSFDATRAKAGHKGGAAAHSPAVRREASATPPPVQTNMPLNMITLSREDYAASDISRLPSHSEEQSQQSADAGTGSGDSAFAPGKGPNGERLYQVEWYRRPTDAELRTYLPHDAPGNGWGLIECQTIERFHVDNCRELADSPPGSGYARAVREAAWQFLVRPPRLGGQSLVGAWVGIRIDYGTVMK